MLHGEKYAEALIFNLLYSGSSVSELYNQNRFSSADVVRGGWVSN